MTTPLTATQIIADLKALDRIERGWTADGRLDSDGKKTIDDKRYELLIELRGRFTTIQNGDHLQPWAAYREDRYDPGITIGWGKTEIEAIENLLERIGEEA